MSGRLTNRPDGNPKKLPRIDRALRKKILPAPISASPGHPADKTSFPSVKGSVRCLFLIPLLHLSLGSFPLQPVFLIRGRAAIRKDRGLIRQRLCQCFNGCPSSIAGVQLASSILFAVSILVLMDVLLQSPSQAICFNNSKLLSFSISSNCPFKGFSLLKKQVFSPDRVKLSH